MMDIPKPNNNLRQNAKISEIYSNLFNPWLHRNKALSGIFIGILLITWPFNLIGISLNSGMQVVSVIIGFGTIFWGLLYGFRYYTKTITGHLYLNMLNILLYGLTLATMLNFVLANLRAFSTSNAPIIFTIGLLLTLEIISLSYKTYKLRSLPSQIQEQFETTDIQTKLIAGIEYKTCCIQSAQAQNIFCICGRTIPETLQKAIW